VKKIMVLYFAVVLISFIGSSIASPHASKTIELTINNTTALVNGEKKTLEQAPIILNQRTLVPLRFIGEEIGAKVEWDNANQKITMTMDYAPYYKESLNLQQASEEIPLGNTPGNLAIHTEYALYNDWIYTIRPFLTSKEYPREYDYHLIRMRSDGADRSKLGLLLSSDFDNSSNFGMFNIVDDYLYFAKKTGGGSIGFNELELDEPAQLCKTDLMGNGIQVLYEGFFHTMFVYGDWIYLTISEKQQAKRYPSKCSFLYRMKSDGTQMELLLPESTYYPMMYQGYLYATVLSESDPGIYRMLPDGSNRIRISKRLGAQLQADGGWIYFIEYNDKLDQPINLINYASGDIYKVRGDGTEESLVKKGKAYVLNVSNAWAYFCDSAGMFRLHLSSNDLHRINNEPTHFILLFHDKVYFHGYAKEVDNEEGGGTYLMRTDGSNKRNMEDIKP
jgi:hypothetical protein